MSSDEPVTRWLCQLKAGDENAPRLLWERYFCELVNLARVRLGTTPRRVVDEEDVALSVLGDLCQGVARGQFDSLVNRHDLWQLLAAITIRKVIDCQRWLGQQKRGGGKVRGDSVLGGADGESPGLGFDGVSGDAPTPEVLAIAAEEHHRLVLLLGDDRLRQIAQFKLEGYTNDQIASRLSLTCRSIERKLQQIRKVWEGELAR